MICPKCQFENEDDSKFCTNCGAKLETENVWYYMDHEEKKGPFSAAKMQEMYETEIITKNTFVWETGMEDWILFRDSVFNHKEEIEDNEEKIWFYDYLGQSQGPKTKTEMIDLIQNHTILSNTYVWKHGMKDWILLKDSELAYLVQKDATPALASAFGIQKRSVVLSIVLTLITCGLYQLYWYYALSEDVNTICAQNNQKKPFDSFLNVILIVCTCGLYAIYFLWKSSKIVYSLKPDIDDTMVVTILAIFIRPISCAILQDEINTYVQ